MKRKTYPSDLSDEQWLLLEPMLSPPEQFGRRRSIELRQICNALFYVLRTGCAWRYLPQDYPCWQTVYYYFRLWRDAEWFADLNENSAALCAANRDATKTLQRASLIGNRSKRAKKEQPSAVLTRAKRSTGANGISLLTRLDYCWRSRFTRRTFKTAMAANCCSRVAVTACRDCFSFGRMAVIAGN